MKKRLKGIVIRGAVIGALAGNKDSLNDLESELINEYSKNSTRRVG